MLLQIHALAGRALALLLEEMLELPDSKQDKADEFEHPTSQSLALLSAQSLGTGQHT